ncbi:hypothetical protein KW807_00875 [Candidatus Parcubacteria bacterium]|nr:hypothetical protein [Candidatus Parcubacteria bacterium]
MAKRIVSAIVVVLALGSWGCGGKAPTSPGPTQAPPGPSFQVLTYERPSVERPDKKDSLILRVKIIKLEAGQWQSVVSFEYIQMERSEDLMRFSANISSVPFQDGVQYGACAVDPARETNDCRSLAIDGIQLVAIKPITTNLGEQSTMALFKRAGSQIVQ